MNRLNRPPFPFPLLHLWFLRILPVWCLIASVIFVMQILVCAFVHDSQAVKVFLAFLDLLPPPVKTMLGGDMLQAGNISGLIAIGYQHPLVLILCMVFAVGVPTGLLAGEVQQGTMELILSRPASKTHVYVCAGALTLAGMFALVLVMFLGTVVSTSIYEFKEKVSLYPFFRIAVNGSLLAGAVGAIALVAAASFRRRNTAVGVSIAYLVVNYLAEITAQLRPHLRFLEPATLFYYVKDSKVLSESAWPVGDMSVLAVVLVFAAIAGGVVWRHRDLPL